MPWIIDYPLVLDAMRAQGFRCLYFNSGAFAFPEAVATREIEWPRVDAEISRRIVAAWRSAATGPAWLMPMSHWQHAFEQAGEAWWAAVIESTGLDPGQLCHRTNAAAIEFADTEADALRGLLDRLAPAAHPGDLTIAFPRRPVLCELLSSPPRVLWRVADATIEDQIRNVGD